MVTVNPDIFKLYDVRGVYGRDFDVNFAEEFGNKIARALKATTMVIGRDSRTSSSLLEKAILQGLLYAGVEVYEVGICTTPVFYYAVQAKNADGGIMITASHNPEEYNGFKVVGPKASIIGGEQLREIFLKTELNLSGSGNVQNYDGVGKYADAVAKMGGGASRTFTVGLTASPASEKILNRIGEKTGLLIQKRNPDGLNVELDDDADRITFFDRQHKIEADFITLLIAEYLGLKRIVHDFRFSKSVREQFKKLGIVAIPSKVGRLHIYENMKNYEGEFGAELSGHYYLKEFNCLESPEMVLLWIRNIIQKTGKNLQELIKPFDKYFRTSELSMPYSSGAFDRIEQKYSDAKISKDDGILVEYDDWWLSLRKSNTEPMMRLIIEAKNVGLLERKLDEINETLRR